MKPYIWYMDFGLSRFVKIITTFIGVIKDIKKLSNYVLYQIFVKLIPLLYVLVGLLAMNLLII